MSTKKKSKNLRNLEILKLFKNNFKEILQITTKAVIKGKIIICPTDTVYGLICSALDKKAVNNVFKIKKRPKNKYLPIFVKDIKQVKKIAEVDRFQEKFLKKVWPGKVTIILKRKKAKIYGVSKNTIALRIPKYEFLNEILKKTNLPLVGTSANISGNLPSIKIKEVLKHFKDKKLLVIDKGNLKKSKSSTIIDLTKKKIKIIRQGDVRIKI